MGRASRTCVFCGARKVSKEHVIPKWVGKVLPKDPDSRWQHSDDHRSWATDHLDFAVRRVCRSCNHGWMEEDIETPARPVLTHMIEGDQGTLNEHDQERVAAWMLKTHAMAQLRRADIRPITEELRASLYERKVAPVRSQVWLTGYVGHPTHGAWGKTHQFELWPGQNVSPDEILDGETMTLCIGHLVLQSFKWSGAPTQFEWALPDELKPFLVPIWPPTGTPQAWPGTWTLDNMKSLRAFAQTWLNTGEPPQ